MSGAVADPFTSSLLADQSTLKSCSSLTEFQHLLSAALNDHVIAAPTFDNQLRKLSASIVEPAGQLHSVIIAHSFCYF